MWLRGLFVVALGIVWLNVVVLFMFRTRVIYRFITKKGEVRHPFEEKSLGWLCLGGFMVLVYLLISDFLVFGQTDRTFPEVFVVNLGLMVLLLAYNALVINQWLLVVVRPIMLNVSKLMTPITIRSYTRFLIIQGGVAAFFLSMVSAWIYLLINYLAR